MTSESEALFQNPEVFITIHSKVYSCCGCGYRDRRIELNWNNFDDYQSSDIVALFEQDPETLDLSKNIKDIANEFTKVHSSRGHYTTKVQFEREPSPLGTGDTSLGWFIAYLRKSKGNPWEILKTNGFRTRPYWMSELRDVIGNIPLVSLMIPGTHDSGAWEPYKYCRDTICKRYYSCQEDSIYEQLVQGIRYLDCRVGYYPKKSEKFWTNHDKFRIRPLIFLLKDVKRFVEETKEIIFLDFHRFPVGFKSEEVHQDLFKLLWGEIGNFLVPKTVPASELTPNMLWNSKKTIILTYKDSKMVKSNEHVWPPVNQAWADKNKLDELEEFLENALDYSENEDRNFRAAMAELTPRVTDIIFKPIFGLRGFADLVNIPVTYWFQRESWYSKCMIIATDYFMGNNLIEMAVLVNRHKGNSFKSKSETDHHEQQKT